MELITTKDSASRLPHFALNRARRTARLSQVQLALKADVDYMTIQRIELGLTRNPQEETKHKIAEALGVEVFSPWP